MSRKIIVTSNCITGGLAAALQALFPEDAVIPISIVEFCSEANGLEHVQALKSADAWVCIKSPSLDANDFIKKYEIKTNMVLHPNFLFNAFHPDMCYVTNIKTNRPTSYHYNSAILVWAYKQSLSIEKTVSLFTEPVMSALGYGDMWGTSVELLRASCQNVGLDFDSFFLDLKRLGCFMYSLNHPRPPAIACIGKMIALKLGLNHYDPLDELIIGDGLFDNVWALYPYVAEQLALPGGYRFKINRRDIVGLENFVRFFFQLYESEGYLPDDLLPHYPTYNEEHYNAVLGAEL